MQTLTVKEVASRLGVSIGAIYKEISKGSLKHYRVGAAIRVSEEHFQAWLSEIEKVGDKSEATQSFSHLDL